MCGIFGAIQPNGIVNVSTLNCLANHAEQRGKDSSGLFVSSAQQNHIYRADAAISQLLSKVDINEASIALGHSRLITNGFEDNQPIVRDSVIALHNGIITNADDLFEVHKITRCQEIDTEILPALYTSLKSTGLCANEAAAGVLSKCEGIVSAVLVDLNADSVILMSNNGSLYYSLADNSLVFASEEWPLKQLNLPKIENLRGIKVHSTKLPQEITSSRNVIKSDRPNLVPKLCGDSRLEKLLVYPKHDMKRCTKCILPETMPFIEFDLHGVCNYCNNYVSKKVPNNLSKLSELLAPFKRADRSDCIMPFSGGRDSCMALHLAVNELGMKPVTFTYDWGMVTDLGRRNISRMCSALGVENIIVAADIRLKRNNIRKNVSAWLESPHLGMVNLFTAGDKHFFQHVETIKRQTGISLNVWGANPLETTHFKTGFLGMPPSFSSKSVYNTGILKQLKYQALRANMMFRNPKYLNSSIPDTISGEYWRSVNKKTDYFHVFDYYNWEESEVDGILDHYNWERATDTTTSWRIGDGTAAFYNYIYRTVAGFTEHDTFRSNQIREGQISRDRALSLIDLENEPRLPNIRWYLESIDIDFETAIRRINNMPRMYH